MKSVGIRELKEHTGEIVREVREQGQPVEVTDRGQAIAMIVPIPGRASREDMQAAIRGIDELAAEIGSEWRGSTNAVDVIREQRRDL